MHREPSSTHAPTARARNYAALRAHAETIAGLPDRSAQMDAFIAMLWSGLAGTGISWVGFYIEAPGAPEQERLMLAAREPGPACSPIGLHGACGACFLSASPLVVQDVRSLGAGYIACDPRDRSELVLPCMGPDRAVWGVLDLDSHETASFTDADAQQMQYLLRVAGLSQGP